MTIKSQSANSLSSSFKLLIGSLSIFGSSLENSSSAVLKG